jgi:hypothetical protein
MEYQAGKNRPRWFKTYVLRRKGLSKPQLTTLVTGSVCERYVADELCVEYVCSPQEGAG